MINCYNKAIKDISTEKKYWIEDLEDKFSDMLFGDDKDSEEIEILGNFFQECDFYIFGENDSFSYRYISEIINEIVKGNTKIEKYNITIVEGE